jgi:GNAT superfamily N-acetyltransferase
MVMGINMAVDMSESIRQCISESIRKVKKATMGIDISTLHEVTIIRQDKYNYDVQNPTKTDGKYVYKLYFETPVNLKYMDINANEPTLSNFHDRNSIDELASTAVGYITYRLVTGQIGLFFINKKYQNRGLGKQILNRVITDMKHEGKTHIFAITTPNHPFWTNVFNKSFQWKQRPDASVTGSGYHLDFSNLKSSNSNTQTQTIK